MKKIRGKSPLYYSVEILPLHPFTTTLETKQRICAKEMVTLATVIQSYNWRSNSYFSRQMKLSFICIALKMYFISQCIIAGCVEMAPQVRVFENEMQRGDGRFRGMGGECLETRITRACVMIFPGGIIEGIEDESDRYDVFFLMILLLR